jgi:hypothetical protein
MSYHYKVETSQDTLDLYSKAGHHYSFKIKAKFFSGKKTITELFTNQVYTVKDTTTKFGFGTTEFLFFNGEEEFLKVSTGSRKCNTTLFDQTNQVSIDPISCRVYVLRNSSGEKIAALSANRNTPFISYDYTFKIKVFNDTIDNFLLAFYCLTQLLLIARADT